MRAADWVTRPVRPVRGPVKPHSRDPEKEKGVRRNYPVQPATVLAGLIAMFAGEPADDKQVSNQWLRFKRFYGN